jgi:hypothetical protein
MLHLRSHRSKLGFQDNPLLLVAAQLVLSRHYFILS